MFIDSLAFPGRSDSRCACRKKQIDVLTICIGEYLYCAVRLKATSNIENSYQKL